MEHDRIGTGGPCEPLDAPEKGTSDTSYLKVRQLRRSMGITLKQLATDSTLSLSYLSNYENGKVNITINSLRKIAEALGISVADLITDDPPKDITLIRKEDRYVRILYKVESGTALQEYLMRNSKAAMHVLFGTLPPHSDSGDPSSHYGEEFILSTKGVVSVMLNNAVYQLNEGDAIYYNSSHWHKVANEQNTEIEYLHVNTPPTY